MGHKTSQYLQMKNVDISKLSNSYQAPLKDSKMGKFLTKIKKSIEKLPHYDTENINDELKESDMNNDDGLPNEADGDDEAESIRSKEEENKVNNEDLNHDNEAVTMDTQLFVKDEDLLEYEKINHTRPFEEIIVNKEEIDKIHEDRKEVMSYKKRYIRKTFPPRPRRWAKRKRVVLLQG